MSHRSRSSRGAAQRRRRRQARELEKAAQRVLDELERAAAVPSNVFIGARARFALNGVPISYASAGAEAVAAGGFDFETAFLSGRRPFS